MRPAVLLALMMILSISACDKVLPSRAPEVPTTPPTTQPELPTAPVPKPAPRPARPAAGSPAVTENEAFARVRRSLRRLVAAEQGFYAENGVYTEDLDRLGYRPDRQAEVEFLWVRRESWAARGTHPGLGGRDCVIFVGPVTPAPTSLKYRRSAREGIPACDDTPPPSPRANSAPPASAADTGSALDAVNPTVQMRVDLRNLVRSQNAYLATQGIYSRRMEPLALQYIWRPGVRIILLSADDRSWSATATHAARPGKSCVIWYGPVPYRPATEAQGKRAEEPAVPACDD